MLIANTVSDLRRLLLVFETVALKWGLQLNVSQGKTEWMCVPALRGQPPHLSCAAGHVALVTAYKYLGVLLGAGTNTWRADLKRRVQLVQASVARSAAIWRAPIDAETKAHLA